MCRSVAFPD
ncbi:hypothetical protein E2C01_100776 [Portunus trituberculatus]|uniref:Uncharacterized protein n=1 Tax=Portunus trituberculatus TaxID=210409 RepID=A0A5B7KKE0_PORTR|nr:hypothetical protein [Portunus trituberculatus]